MATKAQIESVTAQAEEQCRNLLRKGKGHEKQVAHLRDLLNAARRSGWKGDDWKALEAEVSGIAASGLDVDHVVASEVTVNEPVVVSTVSTS